MAIRAIQPGGLATSKRQTAQITRMPAPFKGIDARSPLAAASLDVCIYCYNLVPQDGGLGLRKGYRERQIDLDDGNGISVNTIVPYDGLEADGSEDRLFAVTNEGIWDVTTQGGTPTLKATFGNQTKDAGFGPSATFVTDAGDRYLAYADSLNGLFVYDSATDSWAQASGITGPTIENINFVAVHKERIWVIERGASDAWYLDIAAITGTATKFQFGSKMKNGGALRGLFNWSIDGGAGVDDLLVGVSGSGDVVVYKGTDPGADFTIQGVYFIGSLPKGPNFATEDSGELYLLSTYGVVSMTDLLSGVSIVSSDAGNTSARIAGQLRGRMATQSTLNGWAIRTIPSEGGFLISSPTLPGTFPIQYYYNITVAGWGLWRNLDVRSFVTWKDSVVFGDGLLRVLTMDREADNVKVNGPAPPEFNGQPIQFSLLTSYSALGAQGVFKRVKYIRPDIVGTAEPAYAVASRFDYTLNEADLPVTPNNPRNGVWDLDTWDTVVWTSESFDGWNSVYGAYGMGRNMALAYRGESYKTITLVGWDVIYDSGGPLV